MRHGDAPTASCSSTSTARSSSTGGAGAVAWRRAFEELHGIPADIGKFTDAGMTDPDVGAKTFEAVLGRKPTPHELAQVVQRRLEHLPEAVAESEGYKVLPGVPERLRQLSREGHLLGPHHRQRRRRRVHQARARRPDALVHVRRLRERRRRPAGDRPPGRRARRGDARRGRPEHGDLRHRRHAARHLAAHAVGCTAIGVATGHYDAAALREAGADHVLETMEEELPLT